MAGIVGGEDGVEVIRWYFCCVSTTVVLLWYIVR